MASLRHLRDLEHRLAASDQEEAELVERDRAPEGGLEMMAVVVVAAEFGDCCSPA